MGVRTARLSEEEREKMIEEYGEAIEEQDFKGIRIYADGACSGNPGPGGWGALVITESGEEEELQGSERFTTNQRMELTAVINALETIKGTSPILVVSDSQYVVKGGTKWMWNWAKYGWKKFGGGRVLNRDLWEDLYKLVQPHYKTIRWLWRKGHNGHPELEHCHDLAKGSNGSIDPERGYIEE
jgi:ribonuclease HI